MKIKVPDYFNSFKCIADRCTDSCCIGWEIAIDEETIQKYSTLDCEIGREIVEKTAHGCFPLEKNGRCAFLDGKGLCRIISAFGDGYLCDICREHPRYYGVGKGCIEGGLGLGCEEAARIILSLRSLPRLVEIERDIPYYDEDDFADISEHFREILYNEIFSLDIRELIGKYQACAVMADGVAFDASAGKSTPIPQVTFAPTGAKEVEKMLTDSLSLLSECEALTDNWCVLLDKAKAITPEDILEQDKTVRSLLYYFTHRYVREGVEDMSLGVRILFALVSALSTVAVSRVIGGEDAAVRAAVAFSKNIEYSTDNVDLLLDSLSELL